MCQRHQTSKRTPHTYPSKLIPLAKGGYRYLQPERIRVRSHCGLFLEIPRSPVTESTPSIVNTLKVAFTRHSIPEILRSDNGPQLSSQEFKNFTDKYDIKHNTSSPHFPSSNGQAERAVQTVKNLLKNSTDPFLALLLYRATPLPWCGRSSSELLMGRKI